MPSKSGDLLFDLLRHLVSVAASLHLGPVTIKELARTLKASQRTILRNIEILKSLDAPIAYEATGYTYKLRKSWNVWAAIRRRIGELKPVAIVKPKLRTCGKCRGKFRSVRFRTNCGECE